MLFIKNVIGIKRHLKNAIDRHQVVHGGTKWYEIVHLVLNLYQQG